MAVRHCLGLFIFVALSLRLNAASIPLKITTILIKPLMMLKQDEKQRTGNDRFEGFIPDLLSKLSQEIQFEYTINVVHDNRYGGLMEDNKTWNGMIGELTTRKADIAAADLTITALRMQAVDFTHPFMMSGIGLLMKKPVPEGVHPGFFFKPFTKEVWMCLIIAFLGFSILFFVFARFSSAEWVQSKNSSERENNLAVCNALYFTLSTLTLQNAKVSPRGFSTRVLASVWWIFSAILICTYIANLSALFVKEIDLREMMNSVKDAETLSEQSEIQYGTVQSGSTNAFFKGSQVSTYQFMYQEMLNMDPSPFVATIVEGVERVRKGKFAFFMEHTAIEYLVASECDLMSVGSILDYKGYGFAFRKHDPFKESFSNKVLSLQESGIILQLRRKWWPKAADSACKKDSEEGSSLTLHSLHGLFVFLPVGIFFAFAFAVAELFWRARSSRAEGESICGEVIREATFALCGSGSNPRANDKRNGQHGESIILERQDAV